MTGDRGDVSRQVFLRSAADVQPASPRWGWSGRMPLGAVTLLAGREGLGKSTEAARIGSALTRGKLPGDLYGEPVDVIYASAEDSPESTLVPRFLAAGADLARVSLLEVREEQTPGALTLPDDIPALAEAAASVKARLLVLDPLVSYLPAEVNAHRDQHVRRVLAPLADVADELGLAVLAVVHLNKGDTTDALARVGGSVGFTAAARSVLVFGRDPDDPEGENGAQRVLAHAKSNLSALAPSVCARIEPRTIEDDSARAVRTSRVVILGEADQTARDLLAQPVSAEDRSAGDEAADFLREELADGPLPAKVVKARAHDAGVAERTLDRAKKKVGVQTRKEPEGWTWRLKDATTSDNPNGVLGSVGALEGTKAAKAAKAAKAQGGGGVADMEAERLAAKFPELRAEGDAS